MRCYASQYRELYVFGIKQNEKPTNSINRSRKSLWNSFSKHSYNNSIIADIISIKVSYYDHFCLFSTFTKIHWT